MKPLLPPQVTPRGRGTFVSIVGDAYEIKLTGEDTGGAYAVFEFTVLPGNGPPPHVHHREHEAFFVQEGVITFIIEGREITAGPGTFLHAPRDVGHQFQNRGAVTARMLCWVVPAGLERFFLEIGEPLAGPDAPPLPPTPEHLARIMAVAPDYGLEIFAPGD